MRTKTWLLSGLVVLSVLATVYEGILFWHDLEGNPRLLSVWGALFVLVLVLWVDLDSKAHPEIYRPYEYGYLVLLWWIPYVPYYLWRTRRFKGLLLLAGFVGLYLMSYMVQLVIYAAR